MKNAVLALTLLVAALAGGAAAQTFEEQNRGNRTSEIEGTELGVRAGFHITTTPDENNAAMVGFHAGAVRDVAKLTQFSIPLNDFAIFFRPGALLFLRPHNWDAAMADTGWPKFTLWLDVPLMLSLKRQPTAASGLIYRVELGPYIQLGLLGEFERTLGSSGIKENLNRFDVGVGFSYGVEFGSIWASLGINQGFMDVYSYEKFTAFHLKLTGGWDF